MILPRKVYAIRHDTTQKIYVGSTENVERRFAQHLSRLRCGTHPVEDMQKDYDSFGAKFSLFILDEIVRHEDREKEYVWMKKLNSHIRGVGYNYNDQEKAILQADVFGGVNPSPMTELICEITDRILRCDDPALLDLVLRILKK